MSLTVLEILYLVLVVFTSIIGTLLVIVLLRLIKILGVVQEITGIYEKIKQIFVSYSKIPEIVKDTIKEKFGNKK